MRRRHLLLAAGAAASLPLVGCGASAVSTFPTLAAARRAVEGLGSGWRSRGAWTLAQMLEHAAQSIEYSIGGFPQPKSALFQSTVGALAFAVFETRGSMSHGLAEPIPGAPPIAATAPLDGAIARMLKALGDFEAFAGPLAPHFAYGRLDKARYTRAHLMHLANHWQEVTKA